MSTTQLLCRRIMGFSPVSKSSRRFAFPSFSQTRFASNRDIRMFHTYTGNILQGATKELDSLAVTVIVDNESDAMSSGIQKVAGFEYRPERQNLREGAAMCRAGHGLSLLLTGTRGSESHSLLLDAGPDPELWKSNAEKLGIDTGGIDAVVLSHYHWDHAGGLRGAIPVICEKNPQPVLVDLQSSDIKCRGRPAEEGDISRIIPHKPDNPSAMELTSLGARAEKHSDEHNLCNDFFYISGYIPRISDYEVGIPNHASLIDGKWVLDEEIADERYVACKVKGRGVVVFSSCSHAGITNVCRDATQRTKAPLWGVIGGFHLGGKQVEGRIKRTVEDLKAMNPAVVLAGHCTGWKAKAHLAVKLEDHFQPLAVGARYVFSS